MRNLRRKLGDDANDPRYIFTEPPRWLPYGEGTETGTVRGHGRLACLLHSRYHRPSHISKMVLPTVRLGPLERD